MIPVDCLATQTLHGFDNGRWWGWEGVDCCAGTCQHVWQYGQAAARLFPEFERDMRERVDFGLAWRDTGAMDYRGENAREVAHDGFCGTIIRAYREHQTASDASFLQRIWPRVKTSLEFILAQDADGDGLLEGVQMNTLDAAWEGPMGWISSLFLGALAAGAAMADEMGDAPFAGRCRERSESGKASLVAKVYDGEYFIHHPPNFNRTNTNKGCHIDQVMGQSMAHQMGLPRVVPEQECRSALQALWKYNFTPDVGPYRKAPPVPGGRWYAMPGEGGLLMCTWPKGGAENAPGHGNATFVGYFNECMNGFEYQVASHMVYEGSGRAGEPGHDLVEKGLAVARMVHDRYAPALRNPYNEIECSDHYARSMASYGVFLAACGFAYHGPNGYLAFAPRVQPENFRAPFTASEGWGTFSQQVVGKELRVRLKLAWGRLALQTIGLVGALDKPLAAVRARQDGRLIIASVAGIGAQSAVTLPDGFELQAGEELELILE
jgi:hypothetical protein